MRGWRSPSSLGRQSEALLRSESGNARQGSCVRARSGHRPETHEDLNKFAHARVTQRMKMTAALAALLPIFTLPAAESAKVGPTDASFRHEIQRALEHEIGRAHA